VELKRGDEVGKFNMGSTIVLISEVPKNFKFNILAGQKVRMGQVVGEMK
jgi:phosphatidylserine decarboxylase